MTVKYDDFEEWERRKKIPLKVVPTCRHCKKDLNRVRDGGWANAKGLCNKCYYQHRINPCFGVL